MSSVAEQQYHPTRDGTPVEELSESAREPSGEKTAGPLAHTDFPEGGARAWIVAASGSGILFCTFGYLNAFGVLQEYYQSHQLAHESPSTISWIASIQLFLLFAGGLVGGPLFDRHGAVVIWPAVVAYLLSIAMTSLCTETYQFVLAQGILGGIGMGMLNAPAMAAVAQYFNKKRGAAMGLVVAGSSIGGVIFPIALSEMLNSSSLGFGWSIRICGFIILVLIIPAALGVKARLPPRKKSLFLPSAFKEPLFLGIVGSIFTMLIGVFLPLFFLPSYAISHGMSSKLSGYLPAILNGASFFGRVIPGITADKLGHLNTLCAAGLGTGILIFCLPKAQSNATIIVFAALYGFTYGGIVSLMSVTLAMVPKNPGDIGTYLGMGMFIISFAALIGPPIDGAFVSHYGGFSEVSIFGGTAVILGALGVGATKATTKNGLFGKI